MIPLPENLQTRTLQTQPGLILSLSYFKPLRLKFFEGGLWIQRMKEENFSIKIRVNYDKKICPSPLFLSDQLFRTRGMKIVFERLGLERL